MIEKKSYEKILYARNTWKKNSFHTLHAETARQIFLRDLVLQAATFYLYIYAHKREKMALIIPSCAHSFRGRGSR